MDGVGVNRCVEIGKAVDGILYFIGGCVVDIVDLFEGNNLRRVMVNSSISWRSVCTLFRNI